ncbi:hypothetical protein NIES21_07140 [Anabaenopsis circularis NIES-21]|uniref:Uncharacterized protein n=1 Tax=Anabaenopsis circularis NIES-21 TaxID=1085406 RepID=A0A1Z4GC73_9CYAN|nr:hypothetical protein NIES21_07140 [Anabaenopsis circularis NIES-21]
MINQENQQIKIAMWKNLSQELIKVGVAQEAFVHTDITENIIKIKALSRSQNSCYLLLSDLSTYEEFFLKMSSKDSLKRSHKHHSRQAWQRWCSESGIEPRIGGNQGQDPNSLNLNRKTFNGNCTVTLEQAITLISFLLRFKLDAGDQLELDKFADVATSVVLHLLSLTKTYNICLLGELH